MKNFTKQNFKQFTSRLSARWLIMALMMLVGTSSAWAAGGAGGPMGVYLGVNGNNTWYKINGVNSWNMSCSGYAFDNANALPSSLGNITSGLSLEGLGIIGWTDSGSDWVAGKINYTITPGSKSGSYEIGNFENPSWGNGGHVRCSSGNNRVTAVKSSINLIDGLGAGDYTLKFEYFARMQWQNNNGNGYYDDNNGNARGTKSATFTIPGYSTTTGDKDFGEVDVNSSSDYTVELTHYGSDNTATVSSITGTNKSEFTATVTKSGDNTQKLTVTFKPTSVAPDKTATIKVTDAYNKTYTLTVTGTGKQSCQAPTSVSVTGSETPCVGANETYTADIVGGSKYDLEWAVPDGYTIIEGQGTTSIIVEVGTTSGNITCTATCGNAAPSDEISVAPYTTVAPTINLSAEYVCPDESATITVESPELNVEGLSYKLYNKNDTSTPIAIITEPKTEPVAFTIQEGTYYVTVSHTCGGEKKSTNEKTLQEYQAPAMPAYTPTPATSCKRTPNSDGAITLKNPVGGVTYALDGTNDIEWSGLAAGKHKLSATVNACPSLTREWDIEVGEEDITPSATVTISGETSFCEGTSTELTCVVNATKGNPTAYQWYNGDNLIQDAINSTYSARAEGNYKVVVTVLNSTCQDEFWSDEKVVTINPKPNEPVLSIPSPICAGSNFTLPEEDNNQRNIIWNVNDRELTNLTAGTHNYTAKIIDVNGCESNEVTYTITVTALPEITSISQDIQEPVFYEDVTLTANATQGATVKWYEGGEEKATGATYVVTSETATSKTVTAKAFLNGCESDFKEHKVTFGNEVCQKTESKNIEITFKHPNKNNNNAACQYWGFGYIFKNGVTPNNNNSNYLAVFPNKEETSGSKTVTLSNIQSSTIEIYLKAFYQYGGCTASTKIITLTRGKKYEITISSDQQGNGIWEKEAIVTEKGSLPQDLKITAPAVKITSVAYNENTGKIDASGAVYKTGCGETFWGFQYSTYGQTWGTADADFIRPSTGNSLSVPGEFDYSFAIPNAGGGDIYYIRAYALNNYNGSYALSNAVYSATSLPVEIPSKTIESATISLVDSEGKPLDVTEVCPQSTVYLKVSYVGGDFKDYEAADNFPGTNLELVNHDKVNNYAIFSYTATTTGVANITISNENTSVTPEDGVSITVIDVEIATPPTIYLEKNTICDNQTTNVVVNSPIVGSIYSLKNGTVGDPVTYESGDLKFPVSKEGSYTVQVQETVCGTTAISAPVDLRVITSDVKITLTTDVNTITPWQPLTLTVKAPSGYDYDLQGLDGTVYTKSGDVYTIKFPRPDSWRVGNSESNSEPKTFTAGIKAGEEPSCSTTTKEIQLVDTVEDCLAVGN